MAKASKKSRPFPSYKSCTPDLTETHFTQLGDSQLYSERMLSLNHASFRLYTYMLHESRGERVFEFPRAKYQKILSRGGFQKALRELESAGFVDILEHNQNLRKPNVYEFSDRWKQGG